MTNIMDYIKSGKGLPPLEDNIPPMPEVKPPREKNKLSSVLQIRRIRFKENFIRVF